MKNEQNRLKGSIDDCGHGGLLHIVNLLKDSYETATRTKFVSHWESCKAFGKGTSGECTKAHTHTRTHARTHTLHYTTQAVVDGLYSSYTYSRCTVKNQIQIQIKLA